jgi:predicted dehydrogenase
LIPGIRGSRTGSLVALASREETRARAWAEEFGIPRARASYQHLLDDPEIDAVYIPLPNELHRPWVLAAADAGKHVLCEKPLALDATEAREMVARCQERGIILMEGFMWRHEPRTLEIRKLVAEGKIGDLRLIRSSFSFPIAAGDWRLEPSRGGGCLWDIGCYGANAARMFAASEPSSCRALAHFGTTGVDLGTAALLEFRDGLLATIDCSFEQPFRCQYELVGTRGVIEVPHGFLPPAGSKPVARLRTLGARSDSAAAGDRVEVLEFEPVNQYAAMVDCFAHSCVAGRLLDPAEDGLAQMTLLEQLASLGRARTS